VIDLRGVSSREQFHREMARHFSVAVDHRDLWASLYQEVLIVPGGPRVLHFIGWADFEGRMPRYARRLKRLLIDHYQVWGDPIAGVRLLVVRFD